VLRGQSYDRAGTKVAPQNHPLQIIRGHASQRSGGDGIFPHSGEPSDRARQSGGDLSTACSTHDECERDGIHQARERGSVRNSKPGWSKGGARPIRSTFPSTRIGPVKRSRPPRLFRNEADPAVYGPQDFSESVLLNRVVRPEPDLPTVRATSQPG